jgi:hypothetical protein
MNVPQISRAASADAMNATISAAIDAYVTGFKAQIEQGGGAGACTLTGRYSVAFSSPNLLSLRFAVDEYQGGASDTPIAGSLNFDVATGAAIKLADLFTSEADGAARLSTESRTRLAVLLGRDGVGSDWIDPGTTPAMGSFDNAWVMTAAGLELTFQDLAVAPSGEGTPTIAIPWASLAAVLSPAGPAAPFLR